MSEKEAKQFKVGSKVWHSLERQIYRIEELTYSKVVLHNEKTGLKIICGVSALPIFFKLLS